MTLLSFAKQPQKINTLVKAGDFSKEHIGANPMPKDLLTELMGFSHEDFRQCCEDIGSLLDRIDSTAFQFKVETFRKLEKAPLVYTTIAQLDMLHSFFHGIGILVQIWQSSNSQSDDLNEALMIGNRLENNYAQIVKKLGGAGLNKNRAYEAIHLGPRANIFLSVRNRKLAWLDYIEEQIQDN